MTATVDIEAEVLDFTTGQDLFDVELTAATVDTVSTVGTPEIELVDQSLALDVEASEIQVTVQGTGAQGPPGASGSNTETLVAGETVSGHRVVATQSDGTVLYASNTHLPDATRQLWITLGAALAGDTVECQPFGRVTEGGWSWTDDPIFLGVNGVLTQTPPSPPNVAFFLQVAASDGPTALIFNPRNPFQF